LSLGFIFESIEIASLKEGLKPSIKIRPDFDHHSDIIADIHFIKTSPLEHPLFNSLFTRSTDRSHFKTNSPLSTDQLNLLKSYVNDFKQIYVSDTIPDTLISQIVSCEEIMFKNSKIFKEILKWIRFSKKESATTQDGMYFKNLAINPFEAIALRISLQSAYLQKLIWHGGGKFLFRKKSRTQLAQASGYFLVTLSACQTKPY